jgi:hypothetical protein
MSHFFWYMQKEDAFGREGEISSAVASCYEACQSLDKVKPLDSGDFDPYKDVKWHNSMGKIRSSKKVAQWKKVKDEDTVVPLDAPNTLFTVKVDSIKRTTTQRRRFVIP